MRNTDAKIRPKTRAERFEDQVRIELRALRSRSGKSNAEIARAVGYHKNTVSGWFSGLYNLPKISVLYELVTFLGLGFPALIEYAERTIRYE